MLSGVQGALNDDYIMTQGHKVQYGWLLGSILTAGGPSIYYPC